ncbi:site-specific integrase [Arcicella sp. LKC2W]|uniref:site-specific integrase n=1 Tax=Arcicella sp. LKC2W TaxID=2984198 RepID=UPI002B203092|nr:site-specific integrase [Arcicella sp. LKC2W]MEA5457821.1 site-specific integrase [Arcicella sp. LKC2W]
MAVSTKLTFLPKVRYSKPQPKMATLCVQVVINNQQKYYKTPAKFAPEFWDNDNQKVRKTYGYGFEKMNAKAQDYKRKIDSIIDTARREDKLITYEFINQKLEELENPIKKIEAPYRDFYEWFQVYLNDSKNKMSTETIKHICTVGNNLSDYFGKKVPTFEMMNFEFFNNFVNYLLDDCKLANSTVNKRLDYLTGFLKFCADMGVYNIEKLNKGKRLKEYETNSIYITKEELQKLYTHEFASETLQKVADLFVFGCSTGLRESDYSNIKPENIKNGKLDIVTIKTGDHLIIPLNSFSRSILEKYNFILPMFTQQKFNKYLKEVGKVAGIDTPEQVVTHRKAQRIEETVPKYELMTSHTARRTFITQSITRGIPLPAIRKMTGHKDLKSFQKYIKLTDKDLDNEMTKWED